MNQQLTAIQEFILAHSALTEVEKEELLQHIKKADKEFTITELKLDRTEKVKRTTAILLEETIAELEAKRKSVEQQNRELEIEASLERVRTVAMSMMKPVDLLNICNALFDELKLLGFTELRNALINTFNDEQALFHDYDYADLTGGNIAAIPYNSHPLIEKHVQKIRSSTDAFAETIVQETELESWKENRRKNGEPDDPRLENISALYYYFYSIGHGAIGISVYEKISNEQLTILKRFRNVFDLAYKRYVDITNAEAQAREAQIEAALERIRSSAMSMHSSTDLFAVAEVLYDQLSYLGKKELESSIIHLYQDQSTNFEVWYSYRPSNNPGSKLIKDHISVPKDACSWTKEVMARYESGSASYTIESRGEMLRGWYKVLEQYAPATVDHDVRGNLLLPEVLYYHFAKFTGGALLMIGDQKPDEEACNLQLRAARVFELAYKRFKDFEQAETQAREAQVEAALERVRSRTLAMQKSDELAQTVAVLFQQLIALGIEPNRLYVSIITDEKANAEFWLTDEDGSKVSFAYKVNLDDNATFKKMYEGWKQQKASLIIDMVGEELQAYFSYLVSIHVPVTGGLAQKRRVQHLAYFSKGFIGLASPEVQPNETIDLLQRFASVLNLTFTRFNDLQMAEAHAVQAEQDLITIKAARKRAEETLAELKATQAQLIQAEKMASLGELTAGIAHEIQNPLNFVNNFSELSQELLYEVKEAIEKGDTKDAKEIMTDVIQNLEKINHHGKRADAIVKGMLQHSRTGGTQKVPSDINVLGDEYIRLCYHGFRAKDKSFHATIITDFDKSIGNIHIIPQEIGRVFLNLLTNAFYAVDKKKKSGKIGYEPTVSMITKKTGDKVSISIADNGNGIHESIREKIFQPFFTTKPTGQGTGLGLSLAYDIIKAHGGEIKVETKQGEGSTFIIYLQKS